MPEAPATPMPASRHGLEGSAVPRLVPGHPGDEGVECPRCGQPARYVGACFRCDHCGFKSACGQD